MPQFCAFTFFCHTHTHICEPINSSGLPYIQQTWKSSLCTFLSVELCSHFNLSFCHIFFTQQMCIFFAAFRVSLTMNGNIRVTGVFHVLCKCKRNCTVLRFHKIHRCECSLSVSLRHTTIKKLQTFYWQTVFNWSIFHKYPTTGT